MATTDSPDRESAQELLNQARAGNLEAAYDLLGKQAPIKTWREALEQIARHPELADVELAAHRALRRPRQVVAGLLDLSERVGTAKAGHVAHAVARLRDETELVDRAVHVRDGIQTSLDFETTLATGDGMTGLYIVLSRPLPDQRDVMGALSKDVESRELIVRALDGEYQRLLELGRAVRWTSGSYRYFLRHALADLALIAETGGRTWDLAYRLLQQQVENPEENVELLDLIPASTRRRFLSWGLERDNAAQHLVRTRFLLRSARAHPDDVERRDVVGALKVEDAETRAEALLTAVALAPDAADVDREIADLLAATDVPAARSFVQAVLEIAPARLRADLMTADARELVAELARDRTPDIARSTALLIDEARSSEAVAPAIDMLDRLDTRLGVPPDEYVKVALALMRRVDQDSRWRSVFESALSSSGVLRGAWEALLELPASRWTHHLRSLLERSSPIQAGRGTAQLLRSAPETTPALRDVLLDAVGSGAIEAEELRRAPESSLQELAIEARVRIDAIERDIESLREAIGSGEEVVEQQMREKLRPIVERAIERAEGNERLARDYRRLLPSEPTAASVKRDEPTEAVPMTARAELEKIRANLTDVDGSLEVEFLEGSDEAARARYLAALDKKSRAMSAEGWPTVLDAYISALGEHGDAEKLVTELFEHGPRMKLVLGLSSHSRQRLLKAATDNGFEVPDSWLGHDTLGEWLTGVLRPTSDASRELASADPLQLLHATRSRARELEELKERSARLEHEAKLAFVGACRSVFEDLELAIDGYVQLWRALSGLGIAQVEPLGAIVARGTLDPVRHEIVGEADADRFVVRAGGIAVDDEVVAPARVERGG